ncbi:alkaline shock response membrane anchor protein AmaP [Streptomyces sp. 549]|uniref:alkaline shock response membrane anchor protein AmaP n=1 Tax=Streptomyces sp. 549 TaxID=3049076 RepID=UPI0024C2AC02|nr:alkaline shock response membrane anchor protein AmaP [Streptomyces sp. 549]MDK1474256.1 alkaline shock response membrane anchor protein AmaP [Streptomyces sp. 549]
MLRVMNRLLLGLVGLTLLGTGLAALAAAADLPRRWGVTLPSRWAWQGPGSVLLSDADRTQWRFEDWWWPVLFAVLGLLLGAALWWLLAQARRRRISQLPVNGGAGVALLRASALEEVTAAEAAALPGVAGAHTVLAGRRSAPRARMRLTLEPDAEPDETVRRVHQEVLENARVSAGLAELPAEVRLRSVRHRAERVT